MLYGEPADQAMEVGISFDDVDYDVEFGMSSEFAELGPGNYVLRESLRAKGVVLGSYDGVQVRWRDDFVLKTEPGRAQLFRFESPELRALVNLAKSAHSYTCHLGWREPHATAAWLRRARSSGERSLDAIEHAGALLDRGRIVLMDDAGAHLPPGLAVPAIRALVDRACSSPGQLFLASAHELDLPDKLTVRFRGDGSPGDPSAADDLTPW